MFAERNYGCRMMEYSIHGCRAVSMENRHLRVSVLVGWGCQIYEFLDKRTDTDFMMRERRGLSRLNGYQPSKADAQGAFWDYMMGGWFEMFPNAGRSCEFNHTVYGQHGEVAYQPWDMEVIADTPDRIALKFTVETMRTDFRLERIMELRGDAGALFIRENVTNQSADPQEYVWGHHFTMGEVFLNGHCEIDVPDCQVVDRSAREQPRSQLRQGATGTLSAMPGKDGAMVDERCVLDKSAHVNETLYLRNMPEGWAAVTDRKRAVGVGLSWDVSVFPHAWIWKEFCSSSGFPMYGRCYAMSIEPCVSSVPIIRDASAAGETRTLASGECQSTWITAAVHHDARRVTGVSKDGKFTYREEK